MEVRGEAGLTVAVLCLVFALWPVVAFIGGLGFTPLTGIAALVTSPVSVPRLRVRIYMAALIAYLAYATVSIFWSPQPLALVDFERLTVRSEVMRIGLLLLAGGALIAATGAMNDRGRMLVGRVAVVALLVQLVAVVVLAIFEKQAIQFFYGNRPDDEGVQNITRNCIIMAVAAPFLVLGLTEGRSRFVAIAIGAVIVLAEVAVLMKREVDAGLLAMLVTAVCYGITRIFPRNGFRILGGLIAAAVMTAPFVFQVITTGANAVTATNSVGYRQAIWQRVLEVISENPVFGSGVGALRTYRELIPDGVFVNQFYIPNHPHNMLLQLWAETGAIGAALVSATIVLVAFRLPSPAALGPATPRIAAVVGGMIATWVSFDLWNEWWWAVCCLLATLVAVKAGQGRTEGAAG